MRIALATVQSPFISGGAELHANQLCKELIRAGHEAEIVTMPFRYGPPAEILRSMRNWEEEDFTKLSGFTPDLVICLKFPTWYLKHPRKVAWILHQHRAVYDLWDKTPVAKRMQLRALKQEITKKDRQHLQDCTHLFANSKTVAKRLQTYNGLHATPLYHPPALAQRIRPGDCLAPFVFFPSRFEELKRQRLLIEAMRHTTSRVKAVLAGEGPQWEKCRALVEKHGLHAKVVLPGRIDVSLLLTCYARCLAVFYAPFNEDYGYVTLEAMLAAKPVVTTDDSGGPLEFVSHQETGICVPATPEMIARELDRLAEYPDFAKEMGQKGQKRYKKMNISWNHVLSTLLEK
jgi:glycosyltransferase involved in cell wall biosynthesis